MSKTKSENFEASLAKLERLVADLESGDKGLEQSLELFEKGVSLAKNLTLQLEDAKQKVEVLTKDGGKLSRKPLPQ